jgi:hypothetical protein
MDLSHLRPATRADIDMAYPGPYTLYLHAEDEMIPVFISFATVEDAMEAGEQAVEQGGAPGYMITTTDSWVMFEVRLD